MTKNEINDFDGIEQRSCDCDNEYCYCD